MTLLSLALFEIRMAFALMRRYPVQTLVTVVMLYVLFMGIFAASRGIAGDLPMTGAAPPTAKALAGFLLWYVALFILDAMSQSVGEEAQTGTLEQLCMSRVSLPVILSVRMLARLASSLTIAVPLFVALAVSTGVSLALPSPKALCISAVTLCGLCGFGYVLAALALLFKRIGNATTLIHFCLLFVALAPVERLSPPMQALASALPLAQGVKLLRASGGPAATGVDVQWALLVVNGVAYLIGGVLVLRWAERRARKAALLGHY